MKSSLIGRLTSQFVIVLYSIGSLLCFGYSSEAAAPTTVDPGSIERSFGDRIRPSVSPEDIVEPLEEEAVDDGSQVTFRLSGITLTGNEMISREKLAEVYNDYVGKDVSFSTLNKIASEITANYRDKGYILARAYIPPQKVSGGVVEIRVVEGFIDNIDIKGDIEGSRSLLDSYISKIRSSKPLRSSVLERYMLLMDDLPGVTARGLLRPSQNTVGAADLIVTIKHKKTEQVYELNNRGTRYLGRFQASAIARANSWLGNYDRTSVRFVTVNQPEELKFLDIYHSQPVGSEGATVGAAFIRTTSQPGSTLKTFSYDSENVLVELDTSYPIIRAREQNLFARAVGTFRQTNTSSLGARISKDEVRVARVGMQYDVVDQFDGVNLVDLEVSQGLKIFKATDNDSGASRANANGDFTKFVTNLSRYQPFGSGFGLLISGVGQYASGPLFASEEFGVGGSEFGKAYDPSEISGDHGAAGKAEVQYGEYIGYDYLASFQAFGFYDGGAIWNVDPTSDETFRQTLASTGAGVRLNFNDFTSGLVEVTVPLHRKVASEGAEDEHDPRFFFNVVRRF